MIVHHLHRDLLPRVPQHETALLQARFLLCVRAKCLGIGLTDYGVIRPIAFLMPLSREALQCLAQIRQSRRAQVNRLCQLPPGADIGPRKRDAWPPPWNRSQNGTTPLRCLTRATGARRLARHVEHRPGKPRERELIPIAWRWEVPQWSTPVVGIIRWLPYIPSRLIIGMSAVTKIRTRDMAASAALRALSAYVTHFLHGVCLFNGRTKTRKSR